MSPPGAPMPSIEEYRLIDGQSLRDLTDSVRALNMTTARNVKAAHDLLEATKQLTAAINALMGIVTPDHKKTRPMPAIVPDPLNESLEKK